MTEPEATDEPTSIELFMAVKLGEQQAKKLASEPRVNGQAEKDSVHLAGEYYVAAELHRRGIHATITYGNAKAADILAFSLEGNRLARVEVKSSRSDKSARPVRMERHSRQISNARKPILGSVFGTLHESFSSQWVSLPNCL
jgi:hypothetical protein